MFSRDVLEKLDVQGIVFETVVPLVGDFGRAEGFEDMLFVQEDTKELAEALGLPESYTEEYRDNDDMEQLFWDHDKHGLLANVSVPEWEYLGEETAKSTCARRLYLVYAETYEELVAKSLQLADKQREQELEKWRSKAS